MSIVSQITKVFFISMIYRYTARAAPYKTDSAHEIVCFAHRMTASNKRHVDPLEFATSLLISATAYCYHNICNLNRKFKRFEGGVYFNNSAAQQNLVVQFIMRGKASYIYRLYGFQRQWIICYVTVPGKTILKIKLKTNQQQAYHKFEK